ncbi:YceD family protein [Corynebacterium propinquum]
MTSPFVFDVKALLTQQQSPEQTRHTGPAPRRIGAEMLAIEEGAEVTIDAVLHSLGSGIMADADVSAVLRGECSRCLSPLERPMTVRISQVFSAGDDFITGDAEDDEDEGSGDEIPQVSHEDTIDLLQTLTDELVVALPFNPVCEGGCPDDSLTPEPDGVSGEEDAQERIDPRWAGLEKFRD